jgi:hypothetical protein
VPTKVNFRDCVHHGIAGSTPQQILASIRAEYCMPNTVQAVPGSGRARALLQVEDYPALERALGAPAFRQLLMDFQRQPASPEGLAALPDYLAHHRYGTTPALVDMARLERALILSTRAPSIDSVGPCCLPPEVLRAHLDLTLSVHPAWQWLSLATPADQWRTALLGHDGRLPAPSPSITRLRVSPASGRAVTHRLPAADFAFEDALAAGRSLRQAILRAQAHAIAFDPYRALHTLLMAGAVTDFALHPATRFEQVTP